MTISDRLSTDELEIKFQERITELEKANRVLRAEIRDANVLHTLSTRYIAGIDSRSICQEIVDAAIAITEADKGNIQLLDPSTGKLKIVAHRGFDLPFLNFFEVVEAGEATACGNSMKRMERVLIEDVTLSPIFIGSDALAVLLNEEVRSVQSTPLVSRSGKLLGIISTHFSQIRTFSENELMLIDILARQATDIIEHEQEERTRRYKLILEGISTIFKIALQVKTKEDMGYECLSVALEVTGSRIGFFSLMGDDGLLHDIAIKDMGWESCVMYDKTGYRRPPENFIVHGIYGHVVNSGKSFFTNDLPLYPDIINLPHFYPPLQSFLGVPLSLDGKIKGLLAVANRDGGYSYEHRRISKLSCQRLWKLFRDKGRNGIFLKLTRSSRYTEELQAQSEEIQIKNEELQTQSEELRESYTTLQESEERFRTMANAIPQLAWIADPDGHIYWYNERWYS